MDAVILTGIRLLGDGLARYLNKKPDISVIATLDNMSDLRGLLAERPVDVVLVDVTQDLDLEGIRAIAMAAPEVVLIALGLREQRQDVIRCGRAGFSSYVARDATVEVLAAAMRDATAGRLACPADISSGLLRALFRMEPGARPDGADHAPLTRREGAVLQLIGRGLTNKEIARELDLSVATVKHHVHRVLAKLNLPRRTHVMQQVRERPWLAS